MVFLNLWLSRPVWCHHCWCLASLSVLLLACHFQPVCWYFCLQCCCILPRQPRRSRRLRPLHSNDVMNPDADDAPTCQNFRQVLEHLNVCLRLECRLMKLVCQWRIECPWKKMKLPVMAVFVCCWRRHGCHYGADVSGNAANLADDTHVAHWCGRQSRWAGWTDWTRCEGQGGLVHCLKRMNGKMLD